MTNNATGKVPNEDVGEVPAGKKRGRKKGRLRGDKKGSERSKQQPTASTKYREEQLQEKAMPQYTVSIRNST